MLTKSKPQQPTSILSLLPALPAASVSHKPEKFLPYSWALAFAFAGYVSKLCLFLASAWGGKGWPGLAGMSCQRQAPAVRFKRFRGPRGIYYRCCSHFPLASVASQTGTVLPIWRVAARCMLNIVSKQNI